jgi:hypothetical protein
MMILDKLGLSDKINFEDWYNTFLSLEKKQQTLVGVGIAVVILVVLSLPVGCVASKLNEKEEDYQKHLKMASEFYSVQQEYSKLKSSFDNVKKQSSKLGGDPLKGVLYNVTDEIGVERRSVTPKTVSPVKSELFTELGKDVTIKDIRFDQMVKLLDKIINNEKLPVKIKKLTAKADNKDKKMIKLLTFTMTTLKSKK